MDCCSQDGCPRLARYKKRRLCHNHYEQQRRAGLLTVRPKDPVERFWSHVEVTEGCWVWTGAKNHGYGAVRSRGTMRHAHRVAYELTIGPVPDGLELDHLCHTRDKTCTGGECQHRACVRPGHLEPVTTAENLRRGLGAGGENGRKTHCPQGHEYGPESTRITPTGNRKCKICERNRSAARAADERVARGLVVSSAQCSICGTGFEYTGRRRRTMCSDECRKEQGRRAALAYIQAKRSTKVA